MWKTTEKLISTKLSLYAGHQDEVTAAGHKQHRIKTKYGFLNTHKGLINHI